MGTVKPGIWVLIFTVVFAVGFALAWGMQGRRLDKLQAQHTEFVDKTRTLGQQAVQKARATEAAQIKIKKETDDEYKIAIDLLAADNKRLRNARAGSRYVPPSATGARSPETACFDRAELESSIQHLDGEVSGIVEQGDQERVGLDAAKGWAQLQQKTQITE